MANMAKKDLRSIKTEKALNVAMLSLLEHRNFGKITVMDICREALISRAAFYSHFSDKYDLLKEWLINLGPDNIGEDDAYAQIESKINQFVYNNRTVFKNLVHDANEETLEILAEYILSTLNPSDKKSDPKHTLLSVFYSGGMVYYLSWQVKNKFPPDIAPMNEHLYEIIMKFQEWNLE